MMDIVLRKIYSQEDINRLAILADDIWHQCFVSILTLDQIDYMVDKFQSVPAMTQQIVNEGYEYYFIAMSGEEVGYTGIKKDLNKLFLSKLYLQEKYRGLGYASSALEQLKQLCIHRKLEALWLTVNRFNKDAIAFYQKKGFETIRTQVVDIGGGYVMDDYVMELKISSFGP